METKIIILLNLLAYSFIVSQSFSYIISLTDVQRKLSALSYIEFRHLTDKNFRAKFKWVFYAELMLGPAVIIVTVRDPAGLLFITAVIAYIAFWLDAVLMLKGNMPINNSINTWTPEQYPSDWEQYRDKWLSVFQKRQILNSIGFLSLLTGVIFS